MIMIIITTLLEPIINASLLPYYYGETKMHRKSKNVYVHEWRQQREGCKLHAHDAVFLQSSRLMSAQSQIDIFDPICIKMQVSL